MAATAENVNSIFITACKGRSLCGLLDIAFIFLNSEDLSYPYNNNKNIIINILNPPPQSSLLTRLPLREILVFQLNKY